MTETAGWITLGLERTAAKLIRNRRGRSVCIKYEDRRIHKDLLMIGNESGIVTLAASAADHHPEYLTAS